MIKLLRHPLVEAVLVAAPLVVLYQIVSAKHVEAEIGLVNNHFFAADPDLYASMFTRPSSGSRRWMHPLLPVVVGLPGRALVALGLPRLPVACALVQLATVASLVVWQLALRHCGCSFLLRVLATLLLGLSFSTLLHGVLPESFAFGMLALLCTALFAMEQRRPDLRGVLLAAACFGTTVTNLGAWAGMMVTTTLFDRNRAMWRWAAAGVAGLLLTVGVFALHETVAGNWGGLKVDAEFERVWWGWPANTLQRLGDLGSVIGAPPVILMPKCFHAPIVFAHVIEHGLHGTALQIDVDADARSRWPAIAALACLALACTKWISNTPASRRLAWLLLANLACQIPVYFLYGDALLAYSMHWTFSLCGGIVLIARRFGHVGSAALAVLLTVLGIINVPQILDVADSHLVYRDQGWQLGVPAASTSETDGVAFTVSGRVGLDSGTARPFLLYPDPRAITTPDAATNQFRLPTFHLPPAQWQWLGDGTVRNGAVEGHGILPRNFLEAPAWVSLRLEGRWRRFRVEGFLSPQRVGS